MKRKTEPYRNKARNKTIYNNKVNQQIRNKRRKITCG